MNLIMRYSPIIVFALVAALLGFGLTNDPSKMPSAVEGQLLPEFKLIDVLNDGEVISNKDIPPEYVLINFWGTWCPACHIEHPYLLELKARGIKIFGVDYKDDLGKARQWLDELGDPYERNIFDPQGRLGFDLGVTGAPETFLVSPQGVVLLRYQGPLDEAVWQSKFVPLIADGG